MSSNSLKQYNSKEIHIAMVDPELRPNPQTPTKDSPAGMFSAIQKRKWKVWLNMADQNNVKIWLRTSPLINDWTLYTPGTPTPNLNHGIARVDLATDNFVRIQHTDELGGITTGDLGLGNGISKDVSNNIQINPATPLINALGTQTGSVSQPLTVGNTLTFSVDPTGTNQNVSSVNTDQIVIPQLKFNRFYNNAGLNLTPALYGTWESTGITQTVTFDKPTVYIWAGETEEYILLAGASAPYHYVIDYGLFINNVLDVQLTNNIQAVSYPTALGTGGGVNEQHRSFNWTGLLPAGTYTFELRAKVFSIAQPTNVVRLGGSRKGILNWY